MEFSHVFYKELLLDEHIKNILKTNVEENNKFNLDLKIYEKNYFDITVLFVERTNVLINGFKYHDTTTQKEEIIGFYNYYLKTFGFTWKHSS